MSNTVFYVILFACVVALLFLYNWFTKWNLLYKKKKNLRKAEETRKTAAMKGLLVNCPACNSPLLPGEDLVSKIYRPMNVSDQLCTINGCPHCYPVREAGIQRVCPVCHKTLSAEDYLVARLFNKTDGKKHVLITGCNHCCIGSKK
ncbi:MAG: hypothetical protein WCQ67_07680 [Treponema sp.]